MHKWWGNGLSGVLTQTIWSTLTLATQINTLDTQTQDVTEETHHDVSPLYSLKNANSETNEGVVCTSRLVHRFVDLGRRAGALFH